MPHPVGGAMGVTCYVYANCPAVDVQPISAKRGFQSARDGVPEQQSVIERQC